MKRTNLCKSRLAFNRRSCKASRPNVAALTSGPVRLFRSDRSEHWNTVCRPVLVLWCEKSGRTGIKKPRPPVATDVRMDGCCDLVMIRMRCFLVMIYYTASEAALLTADSRARIAVTDAVAALLLLLF